MERKDKNCIDRRMLFMKVSIGQVQGRQSLGWMDSEKVALGSTGMRVEVAQQCTNDRKEWRALVHM